MDSIFDSVLSEFASEGRARALGQQIGIDERGASSAVSAALPVLFGALSRNASRPGGAEALAGALSRDHDGSILDDVMGSLAGGSGGMGEAILGHVLGGRRGAVESELGRQTGLDTAAIGRLMATLAPLVMGALGRARRERGLDSSQLSYELGREKERAEATLPEGLSGLGRILDMDGDGQIDDHVVRMGRGLLGRLFGKRR